MTGVGTGTVPGRRLAAAAVVVGTALELGALAVAGVVGAVALDAIGSSAGDDGGCVGALVLPFLLLVASAFTGLIGAALSLFGAAQFLRLTAPSAD